jgi:hypothetical protein
VPKAEANALADAIHDVKERVRFCNECGNLTEDEVCAICLDARRDRTLICVVEQPVREAAHGTGVESSSLSRSRNDGESRASSVIASISCGASCRDRGSGRAARRQHRRRLLRVRLSCLHCWQMAR